MMKLRLQLLKHLAGCSRGGAVRLRASGRPPPEPRFRHVRQEPGDIEAVLDVIDAGDQQVPRARHLLMVSHRRSNGGINRPIQTSASALEISTHGLEHGTETVREGAHYAEAT